MADGREEREEEKKRREQEEREDGEDRLERGRRDEEETERGGVVNRPASARRYDRDKSNEDLDDSGSPKAGEL